MAVITKGHTFANGDQVTAVKLNNLADDATFASGAVDNVSTQLSSGSIIVKDGGIATAKLADSAVTTAKIADSNVTTAKIADSAVAFEKLDDVIDDDTMATASATTLATSESIKAYVDNNGITQSTGSAPYYGVRAWANYNGVNNTLYAGGNIASVTKNGTGDYTFTFTTAMPDGNYALTVGFSGEYTTGHGIAFIQTQTSSNFRILVHDEDSSVNPMDKANMNVSVIR